MPTPKDPTVLMSKVVLDEPEGYRGRRRRFLFPFTRRAGGAALPALLIAASVVVVLIVVGVSQLLPKQAVGQIPLDAGNGNGNTASTDDGQLLGPDVTDGPSASRSAKPSRSASAKASGGAGTPGNSATPTSLLPTTAVPTDPATFSPMAIEAEAHNGGVAKPGTCSGCSGGSKVRFIGRNTGWVTFAGINVPRAMNLQITVVYVCGVCTRTYYISVNGGTPVTITPPATADWNTTNSVFVTLAMPAGTDSIKFYNPNSTADAPDLDRILIKSS